MKSDSPILAYDYKPKKWLMLLVIPFFGIATYFLSNQALTNDRGLIISMYKGIIEIPFSPFQATVFYAFLSICSALITFIGVVGLYRAFTSQKQLIITKDTLSLPSNFFSSKITTIPLNEILKVEDHTVNKTRMLTIIHKKGKVYVSEHNLPKKGTLDEIIKALLH